ncbi:MAG: response regulator transcription factor [Ferruginibacter sp.]
MPSHQFVQLALVDDHTLFRKGFINLIEMVCNNCVILFEADNGIDLQQKIQKDKQPDIILMDISMPGMDGYDAVQWLHDNFPLIKILIVTMNGQKESFLRMLQLGVNGYINKDVEPAELRTALKEIVNGGSYYTNIINH